MTWLLRLACVGSLIGCCFTTQPLWTGVLAAWALGFGLIGSFRRSDLCRCGDIEAVHRQHLPGTNWIVPGRCKRLGCGCQEFKRFWTRRKP